MPEQVGMGRVLVKHFFRRFFDSDTIQVEGETLTTVVRGIAGVSVPGLMIAFFLQNQYPQRPAWGAIEDQYFFVLFSFVVMGALMIFEWEMLFPDRWDFLILSPLPIKPLQMLAAKASALVGFLVLFLVSSNIFGAFILPLISKGNVLRQFYAHGAAVLMAGLFAASFFVSLGGVMLCVLGAGRSRTLAPLVQMISMMAFLLLLLHYAKYGDQMESLLTGRLGMARFLPSLWFLGVYEQLLHGATAPPFAREMTRYAVRATLIALATAVVTYPLAWARMRTLAIEGASQRRRHPSQVFQWLLNRVIGTPAQRAVFVFIGQTISRNNRYQVYLAMYCGTGLALAAACALTLHDSDHGLILQLSNKGLHALMPLLLFWAVAGLRTAFSFPLDLAAGWIFRITGVSVSECAAASKNWVFVCAGALTCGILLLLYFVGWDLRSMVVQLVFGLCLCIALVDTFFAWDQTVPFNHPRMPGRTNLPLMLTLYIGIFPLFVIGVVRYEMELEKNLWKLASLVMGTVLIHAGLRLLGRGPDEVEEEMEGYEGEFQLLGLS